MAVKETVEFGPQNERMSLSVYWEKVEAYVRALVAENPVLQRIQRGESIGLASPDSSSSLASSCRMRLALIGKFHGAEHHADGAATPHPALQLPKVYPSPYRGLSTAAGQPSPLSTPRSDRSPTLAVRGGSRPTPKPTRGSRTPPQTSGYRSTRCRTATIASDATRQQKPPRQSRSRCPPAPLCDPPLGAVRRSPILPVPCECRSPESVGSP